MDANKWKIGDELHLKSVIIKHCCLDVNGSKWWTVCFPSGNMVDVLSKDVARHNPAPREIKKGDRVYLSHWIGVGRPAYCVLAVEEGYAMIKACDATISIVPLALPISQLEHVDG